MKWLFRRFAASRMVRSGSWGFVCLRQTPPHALGFRRFAATRMGANGYMGFRLSWLRHCRTIVSSFRGRFHPKWRSHGRVKHGVQSAGGR